MKINYEAVTLQHIENNPHLTFVCDGDSKKIKVESENKDD